MNFRELRTAAGLTAAAAAKASGISAATLSEVERGRVSDGFRNAANPSMRTVLKLLRLYGKDSFADWLDGTPAMLRSARKAKGISTDQLAAVEVTIGIASGRAVRAYEGRQRVLTLEQLADLLDYFGAARPAEDLRGLVAPTGGHGNRKPVEETAGYTRRMEVQARREAAAKMRLRRELGRTEGVTAVLLNDPSPTPPTGLVPAA